MARSARLSPPDTGLDRTADGYLIQRRQRFALRLPDGWRPSFSPTEDVSFFAVGDVHEVFANSLLVGRNEPPELQFERAARTSASQTPPPHAPRGQHRENARAESRFSADSHRSSDRTRRIGPEARPDPQTRSM